MVIDSIQTTYHPEFSSAPGSVGQVRECSAELLRIAKSKHIILMEAIKTAYSNAYSRLLVVAKSGRIGDIISVDDILNVFLMNRRVNNANGGGINKRIICV